MHGAALCQRGMFRMPIMEPHHIDHNRDHGRREESGVGPRGSLYDATGDACETLVPRNHLFSVLGA